MTLTKNPNDWDTNSTLCSLGMIICGSFQNSEASYYAFNAPDTRSVFGGVKGSRTSDLNGYKLLRYDHH